MQVSFFSESDLRGFKGLRKRKQKNSLVLMVSFKSRFALDFKWLTVTASKTSYFWNISFFAIFLFPVSMLRATNYNNMQNFKIAKYSKFKVKNFQYSKQKWLSILSTLHQKRIWIKKTRHWAYANEIPTTESVGSR